MGFIAIVLVVIVLVYLYYRIFPHKIVSITPTLGRWAVVTGATDGIGKSFSFQLAEKGFNVVLVSRNLQKLETVAEEIEDKFNVSTEVVQADFNSNDDATYARIKTALEDLEIGVLVNNVGTNTSHPEYFLELEKHHAHWYQDILNCNISSVVNMTRIVLPGMVERRNGLIINISSMASIFPSPVNTLYGATKSFVTKFSQDLDAEYRDKEVHIHVLTTGLVATKLSGVKKFSLFGPSPETYVKSALEEVTRRRCCEGYFWHSFMSKLSGIISILFPEAIVKISEMSGTYFRKELIKQCQDCQ